ncbi:MAG: cytochrome C oxidase Cbb3 [Phycisphaerales bacterium]|nr:c-type cytochrome [Phycisphaerae bacterium]NNF41530.1 cytochrome C oxidase Cbb3 [Phycisphaerales bacterium]NNM26635.1 cytochrome C oxidase Cbb3 [Phycisphaerales bacterium]
MTDPALPDDRLLDHEYDGIREFDNPLPGWWVWIFVGSILICFPYVMWYHLGEGSSVHDAYEAELAAYAEQLMATYGELTADDATIRSYMDDDIAMSGMARLFRSKCAQCHMADGSGNIGPNLTDDAWLHVTELADIAQVVRAGVPDKGMTAWEGRLSETQIVLVSAYVAQLSRNPIGGKPPQGDVVDPWPPPPPEQP